MRLTLHGPLVSCQRMSMGLTLRIQMFAYSTNLKSILPPDGYLGAFIAFLYSSDEILFSGIGVIGSRIWSRESNP